MGGGLRALLWLLVVVLAAVAGLVVVVGVAAVSARPPVFLGAGLVVFLVAVATRRVPAGRRRRARVAGFAVGALVGVASFVVTVLVPVGDPRLAPAPVAGQRFWTLATGSQIAWVHLPAQGPKRPTPVVFLHGGPGIADMAGDAELDARNDRVYNASRAGTTATAPAPARPCTGWASTPCSSPSRPPPTPGPTRGPGWPGWPPRPWSSRGLVTTCPGPAGWPTARPYPGPGWSISTTPATTPTRTSQPPFLAVVRTFLTGRPLPIPPWTRDDPPTDYQGPH